jgi:sulfotransferase
MVQKIFHNSSLPRAGSTIIQNILAQNPEIYPTPTSGVFELLNGVRTVYSNSQEFKAQDKDLMEKGYKSFLKNGIYSFYNEITDRPYVIDKCRGWSMEYKFIDFYDPNPKIICMVRDVRAIYASMEKKYRKNPQLELNVANWQTLEGTTTDKRIVSWSNTVPIAPSMDRLYQVILEGLHEKILFVKFEDFTSNPASEMRRIYEYLELPYFEHDFNNVEQMTKEDDSVYGIYGDHKIKNKIEPLRNDFNDVLGINASNWIKTNYKWYYDQFLYF